MLDSFPIDTILLVTDIGQAKEFYVEKLQLEVVEEDESRIVLRSGPSRLWLSLSTVGTADSQTKASWRVTNLEQVLEFIRRNGVEVEEYDDEALKTDRGIADVGFALASWIIDPFGNTLGLLQIK